MDYYCYITVVTCIRAVEPNLYIGTQSGDTMQVRLEDIMDTHLGYMYWLFPHTDIERYCHRGPVLALVGAYGTMGCQGNLMRLFSSPKGISHQFRQEVACSLALSVGYGYHSPWSRGEEGKEDYCDRIDRIGRIVEDQDNYLCILVHLVC